MRSSASLLVVIVCACEGPAGPKGDQGDPGMPGATGDAGTNGQTGSAGDSPWLTQAGVAIAITDLSFGANSTATVKFTLADGAGGPLDASGRLTDGKVSVSFVLAQLAVQADGTPGQYTAYTTRQATSGSGATATQASTESNGTLVATDVDHGAYAYTFAAATTGLDPTLTQTVVALATRPTPSGGTAIANAEFSARADHGAPIARELVTDATCNSCHASLSHHGGRFTSTSQCILCHQPQSSDPFTGNTLDFKVMVHKIHDGAALPSVVGGTPYQIVGYMQSVNDFSTVVFPQDVGRCTACHAGAQGDRWETAPAKPACTSCHDNVSFTTPVPTGMVLHGGGTQPDNAMCPVCHPSTGSIAGIFDKHFLGIQATAPTVALSIASFTNTGPNQTPVLVFTAQVNGAPANLVTSPLQGLSAVIAGPTADFTSTNNFQSNVFKLQGTGALAGTLTLLDASTGTHQYAFPAALPILQTATQGASYQIGMEGFLQPVANGPRYTAVNPVYAFTVGSTAPGTPRRTIVDRAHCDSCHDELSFHGGGAKKDPRYCVMCHNAQLQNGGTPNQASSLLGFTVDFRSLIHKIHTGTNLTQPFQIGTTDFRKIRYPQDTRNCNACHVATNWMLPLANSPAYASQTQTLFTCSAAGGTDATQPCPAVDVVSTVSLQPPTTTACTSCHDAPYTLAHAQLNTTSNGVEACATCHGPGTNWDVAVYHGAGK